MFGLAGEGSKNPVTESWYTNTFELKWVGDDWKVERLRPEGRAHSRSDATDRVLGAEEMADAVEEYGGFTYAR